MTNVILTNVQNFWSLCILQHRKLKKLTPHTNIYGSFVRINTCIPIQSVALKVARCKWLLHYSYRFGYIWLEYVGANIIFRHWWKYSDWTLLFRVEAIFAYCMYNVFYLDCPHMPVIKDMVGLPWANEEIRNGNAH